MYGRSTKVRGVEVASDFVFHSFSCKPTLLLVSDKANGAVVFQKKIDANMRPFEPLSVVPYLLQCWGVAASRKGAQALYACGSDVILVERAGGGAEQWAARTVVGLLTAVQFVCI